MGLPNMGMLPSEPAKVNPFPKENLSRLKRPRVSDIQRLSL